MGRAQNKAVSRTKTKNHQPSIVVVGNGMVSVRFCEAFAESGGLSENTLTVIGDESHVGYDRVKLSTYVNHRSVEQLTLKPQSWYQENGIELKTGVRVTKIDRHSKRLQLSNGEEVSYDKLILATGSRCFVPDIPGKDLSGVFAYRTIEDLQKITEFGKSAKTGAVIGGGLLGLEAAQALQELEVHPSVIQLGNFLMSAQLNAEAAATLQKGVEQENIDVLLGKRTTSIEKSGEGLILNFEDGSTLNTEMVLISAGIVPNSEIALEADIRCGVRGGVMVDDRLRSSDPHIFAIGECALHRKQIYGLVAPGYKMADILAKNLASKRTKSVFKGADLSTRLKMVGIDVVTIGRYLDPRGDKLIFETPDCYRIIALSRRGHVVGGMAVGSWPEASAVQWMRDNKRKLTKREKSLFLAEGVLSYEENDLSEWPDDQLVCNCMAVTKGTLCQAFADGATTCERLCQVTGAGSVCGSCEPLVQSIVGNPLPASSGKGKALIAVSAFSFLVVLAAMLFKMPIPTSVETVLYKIDELWRNTLYKQISGYSVAGVALVGTAMSLRKRISWFSKLGKFTAWRFFHTTFGLVSLFALFAHTGFRFGHNLNFWLMFTFIGLNLVGAIAGIAAGMETRGLSKSALLARRFRPLLTYAHIILFWPFPVLLTFHVLKSYHW